MNNNDMSLIEENIQREQNKQDKPYKKSIRITAIITAVIVTAPIIIALVDMANCHHGWCGLGLLLAMAVSFVAFVIGAIVLAVLKSKQNKILRAQAVKGDEINETKQVSALVNILSIIELLITVATMFFGAMSVGFSGSALRVAVLISSISAIIFALVVCLVRKARAYEISTLFILIVATLSTVLMTVPSLLAKNDLYNVGGVSFFVMFLVAPAVVVAFFILKGKDIARSKTTLIITIVTLLINIGCTSLFLVVQHNCEKASIHNIPSHCENLLY